MYVSPQFDIHHVLVADMIENVMILPLLISNHTRTSNKTIETEALIDSGAAGNFIDFNYTKRNDLPLVPLEKPITVYNVDGTENKKGTIQFKVDLPLEINRRKFRTELLVTGLGRQKVILGCPWLTEQNPIIDWKKGTMEWRPNPTRQRFWVGMRKKYEERQKAIKAGISPQIVKEEKPRTVDEGVMPQKQRKNIQQYINAISHSIEFTVKYEGPDKQEKRPVEEQIPPEYHKYLKVFSEHAANRLPEQKTWDHKIDLKPGFIPKSSKNLPLEPRRRMTYERIYR